MGYWESYLECLQNLSKPYGTFSIDAAQRISNNGTCFLAKDPLSTVLVAKLQGWKRSYQGTSGCCRLHLFSVKHEKTWGTTQECWEQIHNLWHINLVYISAGSLWKKKFDAPKNYQTWKIWVWFCGGNLHETGCSPYRVASCIRVGVLPSKIWGDYANVRTSFSTLTSAVDTSRFVFFFVGGV